MDAERRWEKSEKFVSNRSQSSRTWRVKWGKRRLKFSIIFWRISRLFFDQRCLGFSLRVFFSIQAWFAFLKRLNQTTKRGFILKNKRSLRREDRRDLLLRGQMAAASKKRRIRIKICEHAAKNSKWNWRKFMCTWDCPFTRKWFSDLIFARRNPLRLPHYFRCHLIWLFMVQIAFMNVRAG